MRHRTASSICPVRSKMPQESIPNKFFRSPHQELHKDKTTEEDNKSVNMDPLNAEKVHNQKIIK